jgi:hypothetical protein
MSALVLASRLAEVLPQLSPKDHSFAASLISAAQSRGSLSPKQEHWAQVLVDRALNPQPAPTPVAVVDVSGIVSLLVGAQSRLKWPKVRLATDSGQRVVLSLAGERSRYRGDVMVTDGGPFGDNVYFGRITAEGGAVVASASLTDEVRHLLIAFAADPAGVGAAIGKRFGHCCFCSRTLETKESLHVGYGPVCAGNYGLPWGHAD